jgi:hypothetical protein
MNEDMMDFGIFIFTIGEPVEVGSNLHSWQPVVFCPYLVIVSEIRKEASEVLKSLSQPYFLPTVGFCFTIAAILCFSSCLGLCFHELLFHQFCPLAVHKLLKTLLNISTVLFV